MNQKDFNFEESQKAADAGMDRVSGNSKDEVKAAIATAIDDCRKSKPEFTSDLVQYLLDQRGVDLSVVHPNLMGAMFCSAAKKKIIEHTGRSKKTVRVKGQARRLPIWRSM